MCLIAVKRIAKLPHLSTEAKQEHLSGNHLQASNRWDTEGPFDSEILCFYGAICEPTGKPAPSFTELNSGN